MTKPEEFAAEFAALLAKYKAEVRIEETTHGYDRYATGINIEFDGEMIGEEYVMYPDLKYGTTILWK